MAASEAAEAALLLVVLLVVAVAVAVVLASASASSASSAVVGTGLVEAGTVAGEDFLGGAAVAGEPNSS